MLDILDDLTARNNLGIRRTFIELVRVYMQLADLGSEYPGFASWYFGRVIPGLFFGERLIITYSHNNILAGIAILKSTPEERKICTLKVRRGFFGEGLGKQLLRKSIDLLETARPIITVSGHNVHKFERLFDFFGFEVHNGYPSIYRAGVIEYSFNGPLSTDSLVGKRDLLSNRPLRRKIVPAMSLQSRLAAL